MESKKVHARFFAAFAAAERREGERSETERSAAAGRAGANQRPGWKFNPEVVAKPKRRIFAAEYKQRILSEVDEARQSGTIGALLRREGSTRLTWRRSEENGRLASLMR